MTASLTGNLPQGFSRWDVADHLKTEEDMQLYLDACLEEDDGDGRLVNAALGDIARARGMSQTARDTGLSREGLYKALSAQGNPEFSTILKVTRALGLRLRVSPQINKDADAAAGHA
jgi:probable addiction module antidote protein